MSELCCRVGVYMHFTDCTCVFVVHVFLLDNDIGLLVVAHILMIILLYLRKYIMLCTHAFYDIHLSIWLIVMVTNTFVAVIHRTCLNAAMYGITAKHVTPKVHGLLFEASTILAGINAFTLCLSLNHQRKYLSLWRAMSGGGGNEGEWWSVCGVA